MKAKALPSYNEKKKPVQNQEKISFNGVSSTREATEEVEDQQQACTINRSLKNHFTYFIRLKELQMSSSEGPRSFQNGENSSGISREGVENIQTS